MDTESSAQDQASSLGDSFVMVDHMEPKDYLDSISKYIEDKSHEYRRISLSIHDDPELGYKEFHAHNLLTDYMEKQKGWKVTRSAYDIKTAFVAVYDSGKPGPAVSFNSEYDALIGIGHACGHNLICVASLAAALTTAEVMANESLGGKVYLFGTPAEEGGGGKIKLLKAGAYKGVDVSLMGHPGITPDGALIRTAALSPVKVEYFGKAAHAAARPWDGINALDALIVAYNAISVLRQQTMPGDIIQGMISNGGARPNIIHAYAAGQFVVRATTKERREVLKKKVVACFEAGAVATGATLELKWGTSYDDHVPNHVLGRSYRKYANKLGCHIPEPMTDLINGATQASTDQGNVSYALPSLHSAIWIRSEDSDGNQLGGPHTPDFEQAARTEEAHELTMRAAKALAATAVDVLTVEGMLDEAKKEVGTIHHQI